MGNGMRSDVESEVRIAGAQPQLSDPRNAGEDALWVPFEEVIAVGWE
jgi:hypothetical protein